MSKSPSLSTRARPPPLLRFLMPPLLILEEREVDILRMIVSLPTGDACAVFVRVIWGFFFCYAVRERSQLALCCRRGVVEGEQRKSSSGEKWKSG